MTTAIKPDGRSTRHEQRRREILDGAVAYAINHGLSDLSMRPMAEALGVSHRTLLHHFGSKEKMLSRILKEIRSRQLEELQQLLAELPNCGAMELLDASWLRFSAPAQMPFSRAYFDLHATAMREPELYREFLDGEVDDWLEVMTAPLLREGIAPDAATEIASLLIANARGMLLDLVSTGDRTRIDATYQRSRQMLAREIEAAR